jgi:hypothetical protein
MLEEAMSPAWLTAALGTRFPGIEVHGVTPGTVIARVRRTLEFVFIAPGCSPTGCRPVLLERLGTAADDHDAFRDVAP